MPYRPRTKRDGNHGEIVKAFEALGCSVFDMASVGGGFPDLVVGIGGHTNLLVEIKNKDGKNRIEKSQSEFMENWRGPVFVVRDAMDVAVLVNQARKMK